jgi:uncharacterized protein (DUF2225 family)
MVSCPNCRTADTNRIKSWPVSFAKEGEEQSKPQFYMEIFECPNCSLRFRSRSFSISNSSEISSTLGKRSNITEMISRINEVKVGLSQTLRVLKDRIRTLEIERKGLLTEASELRKTVELRANMLEDEVRDLREELKSLRELLDS